MPSFTRSEARSHSRRTRDGDGGVSRPARDDRSPLGGVIPSASQSRYPRTPILPSDDSDGRYFFQSEGRGRVFEAPGHGGDQREPRHDVGGGQTGGVPGCVRRSCRRRQQAAALPRPGEVADRNPGK